MVFSVRRGRGLNVISRKIFRLGGQECHEVAAACFDRLADARNGLGAGEVVSLDLTTSVTDGVCKRRKNGVDFFQTADLLQLASKVQLFALRPGASVSLQGRRGRAGQ